MTSASRKKRQNMSAKPAVETRASATEVRRLLSLRHNDPHQTLGPHFVAGGLVIRTFRPDAKKIELIVGTKRAQEMEKVHDAGLFSYFIPDEQKVPSYRFKITQYSDEVRTIRDPYSFLPTLGELDLHLFAEGKHEEIYNKLGAHVTKIGRVNGVAFAVWAPQASGVSVVGDFNGWDGRFHPMRMLGSSGVWELFIPELDAGALYKFEIRARKGLPFLKADPYAQFTEIPPNTSSVVQKSNYKFRDEQWIKNRATAEHFRQPLSIYEVHFGSWRRKIEEQNRPFSYREMAESLADYVTEMGFTHVEFLPLKEHPYGPSWGYQVSYYYAPSARYGIPDDLRSLIDYLHQRGIGVIMDWGAAHFPKDAFALGRFDGSALYEHLDPRKGEHPDWGTYIFNYGRKEGEWEPNKYGGRENLEAISFLKELNEVTHRACPGTLMIAEESTSWPAVSHPVYTGGLGFDFKWNMGWMHDTLKYFQTDPLFRAGNHNSLTFGLLYAWSENFILPLSHDEVVHMKGSLLNKMPGTVEQKFANLRALYGYMWAHPGKKLLFMGGELGQWREWTETESLDWHLLDSQLHAGVQRLVRDLNRVYFADDSLWTNDNQPSGFEWIDVDNAMENIVAFVRKSGDNSKQVVCVGNFSALPRIGYRFGLSRAGEYKLVINSNDAVYGGSGSDLPKAFTTEDKPSHGRDYSILIDLPALTTLWLTYD